MGLIKILLILVAVVIIALYVAFESLIVYAKATELPDPIKKEMQQLYRTLEAYGNLVEAPKNSYDIAESMQTIDKYLTDKSVVTDILENAEEKDYPEQQCEIPDELQRIYEWHRIGEMITPYFFLLSSEKSRSTAFKLEQENRELGIHDAMVFPVFTTMDENGLAYSCSGDGLYTFIRYNSGEAQNKEYYNFAHFLKETADAYENKAYYYDYDAWEVNPGLLMLVRKKLLSEKDQVRYDQMLDYLREKALSYQYSPYAMVKETVLEAIEQTYDSALVASAAIYLQDKDVEVLTKALYTLGEIGTQQTLPLLLPFLQHKNPEVKNTTLVAISEIADRKNSELLPQIHPMLADDDQLVRLSALEVLGKIANKKSIPVIYEKFEQERSANQMEMAEVLGRIGSKDGLPLLKRYLDRIDRMDFSVEDLGGFRGHDPHPKVLKEVVEKAIVHCSQGQIEVI